MSSTRKLAAARANGAKARGRKTPEGIARSARNATRHGLLARMSVLISEDPAAFLQLMDSYHGRLCPDGSPEGGCVEELVSAYWRSRRAWAVETEMLNKEIAAQPEGDELSRMAAAFVKLAGTPEFAVLRRYETSFLRSFRRSLQNLLLLQRNFPNDANPISGHSSPSPSPASLSSSVPSAAPPASDAVLDGIPS